MNLQCRPERVEESRVEVIETYLDSKNDTVVKFKCPRCQQVHTSYRLP